MALVPREALDELQVRVDRLVALQVVLDRPVYHPAPGQPPRPKRPLPLVKEVLDLVARALAHGHPRRLEQRVALLAEVLVTLPRRPLLGHLRRQALHLLQIDALHAAGLAVRLQRARVGRGGRGLLRDLVQRAEDLRLVDRRALPRPRRRPRAVQRPHAVHELPLPPLHDAHQPLPLVLQVVVVPLPGRLELLRPLLEVRHVHLLHLRLGRLGDLGDEAVALPHARQQPLGLARRLGQLRRPLLLLPDVLDRRRLRRHQRQAAGQVALGLQALLPRLPRLRPDDRLLQLLALPLHRLPHRGQAQRVAPDLHLRLDQLPRLPLHLAHRLQVRLHLWGK